MRAQPLLAACLFLSVGLLGCAETADLCDPGFARDGAGDCVAVPGDGAPFDAGTDASPPRDAGRDATPPTDAGEDAGSDAGPCGVCEPGLFCDGEACIECNTGRPCSGTEVCNPLGMCVECNEDSECTADVARPICGDTGICEACGEDEQCGEDVCAPTGECVGCLDETDCDSGAFVCDRTTRTCTDRAPMSRGNCEECAADADCVTGSRCVEEVFFEGATRMVLGLVCAPTTCPGEVRLAQRETMSIGGDTINACFPSLTSCEAVVDYRSSCVVSSSTCGNETVDDGAECRTDVFGGTPRCTYPCDVGVDCSGACSASKFCFTP